MIAVVGLVLAVVLGSLGTTKVLAVPAMRAAAAHARLGVNAYRLIGCAEVMAAVGLVAGRWWSPAGAAAAVGTVLLMVGAVSVHLSNRDSAARLVPAIGTAALAVGYLVLLPAATS